MKAFLSALSVTDYLLIGGIFLVFCLFVVFLIFTRKYNDSSKNNEELSKALLNIDFLTKNNEEIKEKLSRAEEENKRLTADNASLKAQMNLEKEHLNGKIEELKQIKEDFTNKFKLISSDLLKTQGDDFSKMQQEKMSAVVNPLKEQIDVFKAYMENLDKIHIEDKTKVGEQLNNLMTLNTKLSEEAKNLANALKGNTKYQGDWGETQLERLFEIAGFMKGTHYIVQENVKDEEGHNKRPDYIVNLSDDRRMIIDCKVSLNAYVRVAAAKTPEERKQHIQEHLQALKNHIRTLSSKEYQKNIGGSQNYVLMFIPVEMAYIEALQEDPQIYETAYKSNIAVATASSLLALLRTIDNLWRIEKQNKNVQEMARVGGLLYDKMSNFLNDLQAAEKALEKAREAYDGAFNKLTGRGGALTLTKRLETLGAKTSKLLDYEENDDVLLIEKEEK